MDKIRKHLTTLAVSAQDRRIPARPSPAATRAYRATVDDTSASIDDAQVRIGDPAWFAQPGGGIFLLDAGDAGEGKRTFVEPSRVAMIEGMCRRPHPGTVGHGLAAKILPQLLPPPYGRLWRIYRLRIKPDAEGQITLDVTFGTSRRQPRSGSEFTYGHFLTTNDG